MNDLETLRDMLTRAGVPKVEGDDHRETTKTVWREWPPLRVRYPNVEAYQGERCRDDATEIHVSGGWTGLAEFHFAADGSIRHIDVEGD